MQFTVQNTKKYMVPVRYIWGKMHSRMDQVKFVEDSF